ncbi:MAG: hypothetical protein GQ574_26465 [Crocinitomix sp.]|nr:hypothetical protein [Crocinitomix sp.]
MRYFILIALFISLSASANISFLQEDDPTITYDQALAKIKKDKVNLKSSHASMDSCRKYLLHQFEDVIFPYWVGTPWDYNGYTNRPGKDKIVACGYFVSTTLKHMGFNWNRYDLAKMYSLKIVENTCSEIKKYTQISTVIEYVKRRPNNLYIVGLDSHVGFILKSNNQVWFVHSNYYGAVGPEQELAIDSPALNSSNNYHIGTFFNTENIKMWLNGTAYVLEG